MSGGSDRERRQPLSRERVLAGAIAVADEIGLESLTMRRLGRHLGVEAMSIYKHVASKDEILDGIVDVVIGEIELPAPGSDWRAGMRGRALSARQVLVSHPWAVGMMETRAALGPAALTYVDAVIGSLRVGGFSNAMAAHAFLLLDSFIYGFVVQELSMSFGTAEETAGRAGATLDSLPTDQYPHLADMAAEYFGSPGFDFTLEFEFGLELILDGLAKLRDG